MFSFQCLYYGGSLTENYNETSVLIYFIDSQLVKIPKYKQHFMFFEQYTTILFLLRTYYHMCTLTSVQF